MGNRLVTLAVLLVLAVGCGGSAAHDAQGKSDPGEPARPKTEPPGGAARSVANDKADTQVPAKPYPMKLSEHPLGPTLGLPLDIHVDSPEVPERLQGPTPMSALKEKPKRTEEKEKEEKKGKEKDEKE